VFGDRGLGQAEAINNFAYRALLRYEKAEDVTAARFSHCVEAVGGGCCSSHGFIIFPYRNMSSTPSEGD